MLIIYILCGILSILLCLLFLLLTDMFLKTSVKKVKPKMEEEHKLEILDWADIEYMMIKYHDDQFSLHKVFDQSELDVHRPFEIVGKKAKITEK